MSFTRYFILAAVILLVPLAARAQQVPYGINYQAVARDNFGKELASIRLDLYG